MFMPELLSLALLSQAAFKIARKIQSFSYALGLARPQP